MYPHCVDTVYLLQCKFWVLVSVINGLKHVEICRRLVPQWSINKIVLDFYQNQTQQCSLIGAYHASLLITQTLVLSRVDRSSFIIICTFYVNGLAIRYRFNSMVEHCLLLFKDLLYVILCWVSKTSIGLLCKKASV